MASSLQNTVTRHWDKRAGCYQFNMQRDFFQIDVMASWSKAFADFIGCGHSLKILDAGCGPAVVTKILLDLGHRVTAVDVSAEMLTRAREVAGENAENVTFLNADVADLPLPEHSFDLIISRYVVWTLPDPATASREWYRLLKPGGRVGIIDGNWYYHYFRSVFGKIRLSANQLYYRIRSGFDPGQTPATHYARNLPATYVRRPDWDLGLLAGVGFTRLRIRTDLSDRIHGSLVCRLKNLFVNPFWVEGTKPEAGIPRRNGQQK